MWSYGYLNYMHNKPKPAKLYQVSKLGPYEVDDPQGRLMRKLPVSHVFITSAYYYPNSNSLGDNAVALNMVVDSVSSKIDKAVFTLVGHNKTHEISTVATTHINRIKACRYATVVALTNTIGNLIKLEIDSDGLRFEIPLKKVPQKAPKPVVFCIAPQTVADKWQLFIMQVHIAKRFGADIHLYIISMLDSYFELVKEYEKHGYVSIDPWLKMKVSETVTPYFEFNTNTAYANRAGAYTDCLLRYKDTAKYMVFLNMEDFIIPYMRSSYLREFNAQFQYKTTASSLSYSRRDYEWARAETLDPSNFQEILSSLKPVGEMRSGIVVLKPSRHNLTGISEQINDIPQSRYTVEDNWAIHSKAPHKTYSNDSIDEFISTSGILRSKDLAAIEEDILDMRNLSSMQAIFENLPSSDIYASAISKCWEKALEKSSCPNIESCNLPQRENFGCAHSSAHYYSSPPMKPFTFHFMNNSFWSIINGCYQ